MMNTTHRDSLLEQAKLVLEHLEQNETLDYRFIAVHAKALVQRAWAALAEEEETPEVLH